MKETGKELRNEWVYLVLILILVGVLRLPSLLEPQLYADEGIYLTVGMAIKRGLLLYRDIFDNKPPGIYLLAAASGTVFWFRLTLLAWNMLTVTVFYELASKMLEHNKKAHVLSTLLFAVLSSVPLFEGNIVNSEVLMILPIISGYLLGFSAIGDKQTNISKWAGIGILFGLAAYFKIPAGIDGLGFLLAVLMTEKKIKEWVAKAGAVAAGAGMVMGMGVLYFAFFGALKDYINSAFVVLFPYLTSWKGGVGGASGLGIRAGLLLAWCVLIWRVNKWVPKQVTWTLVWVGFSLFAATLSARPYPHYLMQVVPPLSLLILMMIKKTDWSGRLAALAVILFGTTFWYMKFWHYPTLSYYKEFGKYFLGLVDRTSYAVGVNEKMAWYPDLLGYIRRTTAYEDRIFVWGTEPALYHLSRRLPAGRYSVSYHINEFGAYSETDKALRTFVPRLVILIKGEREFPELAALLAERYVYVDDFGEARVYRRLKMAGEGVGSRDFSNI